MDEDNSLLSMTTSQDGIAPPDPLRVDWPKVKKNTCISGLDIRNRFFPY